MTSNNLTIPSALPFIDLTKLLKVRDNSTSNNRIEDTGRDLKDNVEWVQSAGVKNKTENMEVDPLALNNQLFKGDTNSLESEEKATVKPTFDPNDPFSIYAFREPEETVRRTMRTTTSRAPREAPRGFASRYPTSDYWVWSDRDISNPAPSSLISFPSSVPRFLVRDKRLASDE